MKKKAVILFTLLLLASCAGGPDMLRYQAELKSHALAKRCADGWFQQLPYVQTDADQVYKALSDWDARLAADAQLLGVVK